MLGNPDAAASWPDTCTKEVLTTQIETTFQRTVDEGHVRLTRTWPGVLATGAVGGMDLSLGMFALYIVFRETRSFLLSGLAFGIGFFALVLAGSELFTENILVPVAAVVAKDASPYQLVRLWGATLATNLAAAWVATGLIVVGFPLLRPVARVVAEHSAHQGFTWQAFTSAVVAGAAMTLMTWMERSTESVPAKLLAALVVAFMLIGGHMNHSIVGSVEMFAALHTGASFGYLDWLRFLGVSALGNMAGGLGLVTMLRLVQVGAQVIEQEQGRDPAEPRDAVDPGMG